MSKIYVIISYGYKITNTYVIFAGRSEKECIEYMEDRIVESLMFDEGFTEEDAKNLCKDENFVKEWLLQNEYIIDYIHIR